VIDRNKILRTIEQHFSNLIQWDRYIDYERTVVYASKAEALIELLEISDCGSTGGFDKKNPLTFTCDYALYDRFITLCKKDKKNVFTFSNSNMLFFNKKAK
jgi:hypothetical protein